MDNDQNIDLLQATIDHMGEFNYTQSRISALLSRLDYSDQTKDKLIRAASALLSAQDNTSSLLWRLQNVTNNTSPDSFDDRVVKNLLQFLNASIADEYRDQSHLRYYISNLVKNDTNHTENTTYSFLRMGISSYTQLFTYYSGNLTILKVCNIARTWNNSLVFEFPYPDKKSRIYVKMTKLQTLCDGVQYYNSSNYIKDNGLKIYTPFNDNLFTHSYSYNDTLKFYRSNIDAPFDMNFGTGELFNVYIYSQHNRHSTYKYVSDARDIQQSNLNVNVLGGAQYNFTYVPENKFRFKIYGVNY